MVGSGPNQTESMGSQRRDHFRDLERKRNREGNVHTTCTSKSYSKGGIHLSQEKDTKAMQLEIDHLKGSLRHERWRKAPSVFDSSFDGEEDGSYRPKSMTPPSESFSYDEDYHHECRNRDSSLKGLGNDAMSRALNQISKLPFTRRIEGGGLP